MLLYKSHQFNTTDWSGGITTELFIYPDGAEYALRNFSFRLSTATVEVESSTFTPLEGVNRSLMVLEGNLKLIHNEKQEQRLGAYDVAQFDGGLTTRSEGKCIDFNLMCQRGAEGKVFGFSMEKRSYKPLNLKGKLNFIYVYNGSVEVDGKEVHRNGLLRIKNPLLVELKTKEPCQVAVVEMMTL